MKVNTDGVLLGAMAAFDSPSHILDIGTGTGVIALMLAQRFPSALVDALEIDETAAEMAARNFAGSPFAQRMRSCPVPLDAFEATVSYHLIVSNPPFFIHSLKSHDVRKQVARHADTGFFDGLLERAAKWLAPRGSLQLVLPVALAAWVENRATGTYGMTVQWQTDIRSFSAQPPIRRILAIGKAPLDDVAGEMHRDLVIYEHRGVYSQNYRELLKDFFLAF
ncbi:tRNA1Val (adenine37-N6)-methyltransferase [Parapedobacter composti]|uniref:tRNA1Val (Adenine37-N6)-methyltransferase n=2 Tax=Parapedobacter composti TaxID=623281 RepID=A0A1I1I321_9SPHI|nr:tRNA1Val (adenine37-N6)-methyltransferase [Parapedobacter composti]